ncbi:DNA degradation protein EddB [Pseudoalteromonas porphyrae]|uniref:ExeM/NucH family extracellular endonuclease n=1 Tax=Pseudoalteromonas TaxID=53246 RepID=UPI0006BAD2FF|nr:MULTISPECIES: ExeM/NucH family extracellular endonuclease [Pseudoalteromonas]KPH94488.1 DNA degradation protein EddB [Pseudoalteromonas porphyrae]NMR24616.1 ExeM/NucH family extracellular endonuclease [Pseudoalteromonas sp. NEC-BIFX-2020_015]NNG42599.1 ExeM/NucH family extracellular endonuclease [Pseudoalteromonas sp. NEC-BIFX-2020_002]
MINTKITPLALVIASLSAPASANLIISEYVEGGSNNKAIELYNNSGAELSLNGYNISLYSNGNGDLTSPNNTLDLSGSLAANSTYVIVNAGSVDELKAKADIEATVTYFNGDDALILTKDGTIVDSFGQLGVDPGQEWSAGGVATKDKSLRRNLSITIGRTDATAEFDPSAQWVQFDKDDFSGIGFHGESTEPTPDPDPEPVTPLECGAAKTTINAIQGASDESPLINTIVELEGIVTADLQADDQLNGFFITSLDADIDNNPLTSEGVFIYANTTDVNVGDHVRVKGSVAEYFNATQIGDVSQIKVCAADLTSTATKISLPVADTNDFEAFEGMLVTLEQPLVVTNNYALGRFGEVELATERLYQGTQVALPGDAANAHEAENLKKQILVDDGSTKQNRDPIAYPGVGLDAYNTLRLGDSVNTITGVLGYSFNRYRLHPTIAPTFIATNPRPDAPALNEQADLRIASFNVLNYFNGDGQGGGFPTSRGADNEAEFVRQQAKLVSAITALKADVIGLMEIENDGFGEFSAIASLVKALNDEDAENQYAFVDFAVNQIGTDQITTALIYRANKVEEVGTAAITTQTPFDYSNRAPIAQSFKSLSTEEVFTVAVAHLKSKGGCRSAEGNNADLGDGQACWNEIRVAGANAYADWLNSKPTGIDDEDIILVGDMNAYAMEDPIRAFADKGYKNVVAELNGNTFSYSYSFSGRLGSLDHAVASPTLLAKVVAATDWHINADEPISLDYNLESKSDTQQASLYADNAYRASDHDPVIIDIKSEPPVEPIPEPQAPVLAPEQTFSIAENSAVGAVIGTLNFSDADEAYTPVVSFVVSGNDAVTIDAQGQLILATELDYDLERKITLMVQAQDSAGNLSAAQLVFINIDKVDEKKSNSGSLGWLSLLALPLLARRRIKK